MAQRVQVLLVDDIDGTQAEETVSFSLDGVSYEIDLNSKHAAKLRDDLASWVGHARRAGGRRGGARAASGRGGGRRKDLAAVREWARGEGYTVSDRGRISSEVQDAYDKAH